MAELDQEFVAADIPEDDRNFEPIPPGDYAMQVIDSEIKDTKSGSGRQLVLTLEITEGPMIHRRIWDRLNISNQNADAQRIAQRMLADLCLAVGIASLHNSEELHWKPFVGRVTIKPDKSGQYGPQNAVRYRPRGGQPPTLQAAAAPQQTARPAQQASAKPAIKTANARPWAKAGA